MILTPLCADSMQGSRESANFEVGAEGPLESTKRHPFAKNETGVRYCGSNRSASRRIRLVDERMHSWHRSIQRCSDAGVFIAP